MEQLLTFQKKITPKLTPYEKAQKQWAKRKKAILLGKGKKNARKRHQKVKKQPKIKTLEAKLKKVLYPYIKRRDGNTCISCGKTGLIGGLHGNWNAGHYIKAELCNIVTRYDERNINSQCSTCNLWKRGNTIAYRNAMLKKYGEQITNTLDREYHAPLPMNFNEREFLLSVIEKYANR